MNINKEKIAELLDLFENKVTAGSKENELTLLKTSQRGFVGTQTYYLKLNGVVLKKAKRLPTIVKFFNINIEKYGLQESINKLLIETQVEVQK